MSDHELIGCSRKIHNIKFQSKTITCRNYSNYSPKLLCDDLKASNFEEIFCATCVNQAWLYFKQILIFYFDKHAPLITKKVKGKLSPWLTPEVKKQMNVRDKLLRKARQSKQEIDWSSYNNQRNRVTSLVKKCKSRYHKLLLKESADSPSKFWDALKKLYPTKQSVPSAGLVFDINKTKISHNGTIANALCSYYSNAANSLKSKSLLLRDFTWNKPSDYNLGPTCSEKFTLNGVSEIDVYQELDNLKRKKAAGIDNLPPGLLKDAAYVLAKPLTHLINLSFKVGMVPTYWKEAKVVPVY